MSLVSSDHISSVQRIQSLVEMYNGYSLVQRVQDSACTVFLDKKLVKDKPFWLSFIERGLAAKTFTEGRLVGDFLLDQLGSGLLLLHPTQFDLRP